MSVDVSIPVDTFTNRTTRDGLNVTAVTGALHDATEALRHLPALTERLRHVGDEDGLREINTALTGLVIAVGDRSPSRVS